MDTPQPSAPEPVDAPQPPVPTPPAAAPVAQPPMVPPPVAPVPSSAPPYWQGGAQPAGPAPGVEFAGYGARIVAYLIDGVILGIVIAILSFVLFAVLAGTMRDDSISGAGVLATTVWVGVILLTSLVYFPYFWQRSGQTPGMKMFDIRVVRDKDGGPVGWGGAILRFIGYSINSIVFGLPIGWLWILFDSRRRGWHDLIGGTVVVKA
jgi:uncharacterized RDD family membrane protein YckC